MRELKQLKDELDVSVLVLAGSREPRRGAMVSENDLMRSRVLCDAADSDFAIGVHAANPQYRYIIQTRSQNSAIKWHSGNAPVCSIQTSDDGFLSLTFDERFVADVDEETRQLICNVKWRKDSGASYRLIAEELGIPKSTAFRLYKKWTPALEKDLVVEPKTDVQIKPAKRVLSQDCDEKEEWEECGFEKPIWCENESEPPAVAGGFTRDTENKTGQDDFCGDELSNGHLQPPATARGFDVSAIPFAAALKRIHVTDLKHGIDGYGREIFIQEEENNGKPIIWYQYDPKGKLYRKKRDLCGISIERLERPWISSAYALRLTEF